MINIPAAMWKLTLLGDSKSKICSTGVKLPLPYNTYKSKRSPNKDWGNFCSRLLLYLKAIRGRSDRVTTADKESLFKCVVRFNTENVHSEFVCLI